MPNCTGAVYKSLPLIRHIVFVLVCPNNLRIVGVNTRIVLFVADEHPSSKLHSNMLETTALWSRQQDFHLHLPVIL